VPDSRMIKYGGNTPCVEVTAGGRTLIIDAGTGIRKLGEKLVANGVLDIDVFITHSHWDHIHGFPFFTPIYLKEAKIDILGYSNSIKQLKNMMSQQMSYEFFPVNFADLKSRIKFVETSTHHLKHGHYALKMIATNHPISTTALRIEEEGKSFVFITDNELRQDNPFTTRNEFVKFCEGADYLVHDAQFTEKEYETRKGWGHSTFDDAVSLALDAGVRNLGFFHHDPNRKDTELDEILASFTKNTKINRWGLNIFVAKEKESITI
jgi:phosphoribosyl 1,2-cyclic phosphodiesterase